MALAFMPAANHQAAGLPARETTARCRELRLICMLAPMVPPSGTAQRRLFVIGSFVEAHCWFVAHAPGADESQHAIKYERECAGKGLAVALGAHRLGAAVDLLVAAGTDAAGDALIDLLRREGLSAAHVRRLGAQSGQGCGLISACGEPAVSVFAGANALLGARDLNEAQVALRHAAVVYAQLEAPIGTVRVALERAHAAGAQTVLNPSPWPAHADMQADGSALLRATRVLVVNRAEATNALNVLGGGPPASALDELQDDELESIWHRWPAGRWLIITLGAHGCVAYGSSGAAHRLPGHAVTARQPIGAGDAFSAGLCAALAQGRTMDHALRAANACGALAASRKGILDALPWRDEVRSLSGLVV